MGVGGWSALGTMAGAVWDPAAAGPPHRTREPHLGGYSAATLSNGRVISAGRTGECWRGTRPPRHTGRARRHSSIETTRLLRSWRCVTGGSSAAAAGGRPVDPAAAGAAPVELAATARLAMAAWGTAGWSSADTKGGRRRWTRRPQERCRVELRGVTTAGFSRWRCSVTGGSSAGGEDRRRRRGTRPPRAPRWSSWGATTIGLWRWRWSMTGGSSAWSDGRVLAWDRRWRAPSRKSSPIRRP